MRFGRGGVLRRRRPGGAGGFPRRSVARAAFLGVGTPELLVIFVVSLVVFGPKGLAQAAKQAAGLARSLAPTIRELQSVSTEFVANVNDELGLEELQSTLQGSVDEVRDAFDPSKPLPRQVTPEEQARMEREFKAAQEEEAKRKSERPAEAQETSQPAEGGDTRQADEAQRDA